MDAADVIEWWWSASVEERAVVALACGGSIGDAVYLEPDDFIIKAVLANPALIGW